MLGERADIRQAEALLRERLGRAPARTVGDLTSAMVDFYREVRFEVAPMEEAGDGLLVQWGTYDWGQGEHFAFDMTRQFFLLGEEEPFQLHMTMRFAPTAALSELRISSRWCFSLEDLTDFEEFARSSPPYLELHATEPDSLEVYFEQV